VPLQPWPKVRTYYWALPVGEPAGVAGQARDIQPVRRLGGVGIEPIRGSAQQRHATPVIAPLKVRKADRQLGQTSPELPVGACGRFPHSLEYLVGMERVTIVD
jgi:hypothetical protein